MYKATLSIIALSLLLFNCQSNETPTYESYNDYPVYDGNDLGLTYSTESATFKVWSPAAEAMELRLYDNSHEGEAFKVLPMKRGKQGVWMVTENRDLGDYFYTFRAQFDGEWNDEVPDPYAKAVGVNGLRAQVVDLAKTDPENWADDTRPPLKNFTDVILYELHIRDVSVSPNSGIQNKGKYLGLMETGTKSPSGEVTGLDHIKNLGVTHVHILPAYDHYSIDELALDKPQFNWGYDPQNYNVPEGSYSTDPFDGGTRIREFKQMVKALHDNGLRVILDVVYNHTGRILESNFNQLVPGYYYRQWEDGKSSDASACGNETASDRAMMRKFMIESLTHWVEEYHIDGFRFDLMAIHDIETMNEISKVMNALDPSLFLYGEGWTAGDSPLPESERALKKHAHRMPGVAVFSDDLRDGAKGSVFEHEDRGFASGKSGMEESIKFGIVGATQHPELDYEKVNYSNEPYANHPTQNINYVSCHDNHTLWDRLSNSNPEDSEADRIKMHLLANTIVLTSQGIPFLHAGVELLRTKSGVENSYKSPDSINQIDWARKSEYKDVFNYYQALIQLRKAHPALRMPTADLVREHLSFLEADNGIVAYQINDNANGDDWKDIIVIFNANKTAQSVSIPEGEWQVVLQAETIKPEGILTVGGGKVRVPRLSALVAKR
ncbi:MAG: type I pullulanase [Bacteroidota bacterium]